MKLNLPVEEIHVGNESLLMILKNKNDNNILSSKEFLKISHSTSMLDDIEFLLNLNVTGYFRIRVAS